MPSRRTFLRASVGVGAGAALLPFQSGFSGVPSRAVAAQKVSRAMTTLVSSDLLTVDPAREIYERHKVQGTYGLLKHDVEVHRVVYKTKDPHGKELNVSGALLRPRGVEAPRTMCYCRGTIIPGSYEHAAPSYYKRDSIADPHGDHYEMSFMAAAFASAGFLVAVPDCIGYGESKHEQHPYMHAPTLGSTALDMLRASREIAARHGWKFSPKVSITGWSEGGLTGLATHKLIDETCSKDEFEVEGSSLLAGCYVLSAMMDLFCSYDEPFPETEIYYWMLRSAARIYADTVKLPFDRIVRKEYAKPLTDDVLALAPKNPRYALDPEFLKAYLANVDHPMRQALRLSDRHDWAPRVPVYLHHGTHDDIVPYFTTQMTYEAMRKKGATVKMYPYLTQDHYQPAPAYTIRSIRDL